MAYIGNVSAFESVGTSELEDGSVTTAKINSSVALGGPSLGTASIIRTNANTINENITIPANTNGMSAGPITIANNKTVTIAGTWSIV
tara:strand:+ start:300 stop:563 length:264 start_codon:yes stop_codon:yes gene_type:complete